MLTHFKTGLIFLFVFISSAPWAAQPIDISKQNVALLQTFMPLVTTKSANQHSNNLQEVSRSLDFNRTLHIRIKQTYDQYPIWGADGVIHIKQASNSSIPLQSLISSPADLTMNGTLYQNQNLASDLQRSPVQFFTAENKYKALQVLRSQLANQAGELKDIQIQPIIYIDKENQNKANYAFYISFYLTNNHSSSLPIAKPTYIIDASSFKIYRLWNDLKRDLSNVDASGVGGNEKIGKLIYDGLPGHLNKLTLQRDPVSRLCYMQNAYTIIRDTRQEDKDGNAPVVTFSCPAIDSTHNNTYWNSLDDSVNGGYSPNNDALYAISVVRNMYQDWYHVPPLHDPETIGVYLHLWADTAAWYSKTTIPGRDEWMIVLGDGDEKKYPSTIVGIIAHEVSHGFTEQHSNLIYEGQSGGINESFSDMTDQAMQYYLNKNNNWMHAAEAQKEGYRKALRYFLEKPSRDCEDDVTPGYPPRVPGENCSIDQFDQYREHTKQYGEPPTDPHYSSGLFNRLFYLISTSPNWDPKKAFDVMVQANRHYWTPNSTFKEAACNIISATQDYKYDLSQVMEALNTVGIDTAQCSWEAEKMKR